MNHTIHPLKTNAAVLAGLLQRLESRASIDPAAYRQLVGQLAMALDRVEEPSVLDAVLHAFPAAADLYENMRYEHAGLCRADMELSMDTERRAREVLERSMRSSALALKPGAGNGDRGFSAGEPSA